jgi:hypothetical protein
MGLKRPGLLVLKQMVQFLAGMLHLPSAKMDYVMTYFRPENKFPDRVFGGFARELNNSRICSLDLFSYMSFHVGTPQHLLPQEWSLHESTHSELWELEQFYKHQSGGLLLDVLNLSRKNPGDEPLEDVARRLGFVRKWKAYSIADKRSLKAVLVVNQSDVGVNLSELLNSIKVLVIDQEGLPWEVLSLAVAQLTGVYHLDSIPLLIYPSIYSDVIKISPDKKYQLWILNTLPYPNEFIDYMQRRYQIKL